MCWIKIRPISRHIIENECKAILFSFIHNAMGHLIVKFICLAHFELVWLTVDHETHAGIGGNGHVDTMAMVEGCMAVAVRPDTNANRTH